jgi:hypothetical protein
MIFSWVLEDSTFKVPSVSRALGNKTDPNESF